MLNEVDFAWLLNCAQILDATPDLRRRWHRLLKLYATPLGGCSPRSFSRIVGSPNPYSDCYDIAGHISAQLVPSKTADCIELKHEEASFYDGTIMRPAIGTELESDSQSPWETLIISNLVWRPCHPDLALLFLKVAIGHLVRWFEGNRIESIMFKCSEDSTTLQALLYGVAPEHTRKTQTESGTSIIRIADQGTYGGVTGHWCEMLLHCWVDSSLDSGDLIKDSRKLIGRVLHEFDFDVIAAVRGGCLPTWSLNTTPEGIECSAYPKWRRRIADDLKINMMYGHGADVTEPLRRRLADEPYLLILR